MITIPIWLGIAALVAIPLSFFFGMCVLAWFSAARYSGDEQRSEPE